MKINKLWRLLLVLPVLASCGNQQSQVQNDIAVPVSVIDVKKAPLFSTSTAPGQPMQPVRSYWLPRWPEITAWLSIQNRT